MANRASNSEAKLRRAEVRIQELELYALETSNGARSLEEQLSIAKGELVKLAGQIEQDRVANGRKIESLKSELKTRGEQLREKNKRTKELEAQMVKGLESTKNQKAESKRKIGALIAKNSVIQAKLDETKKTIKMDRSQCKSSKRKKEKAVQVNSLNSTGKAETETVEDIKVNLTAPAVVATDNDVKETPDCDSTENRTEPGEPDSVVSVVVAAAAVGHGCIKHTDGG